MSRLRRSTLEPNEVRRSALCPADAPDLFRTLLDGRNGATLILITHRLGLSTLADRVIMLDDARVVAEGSHAELMAHDGPYAALFRSSLDAPTPLGR